MPKPRTVAIVSLAAAFGIAFALQGAYTLVINGKTVQGKTAVINGQTYVPLSALKAAGAVATVNDGTLSIMMPAQGGANQVTALEGKIGDWLFDGIWRFRVTGVHPTDDRPGWKIDVELRNGTKSDNLALDGTGFDSVSLAMADGNVLAKPYNITDFVVPVGQGSSINVSLVYYDDDGAGRKPTRLILRIVPDDATKGFLKRVGIGYTVPDPSFRIDLSQSSGL